MLSEGSIEWQVLAGTALERREAAPMDIFNNVIAPIIVATILGIFGLAWGWILGHRQSRRRIEAAPRKYVQELDKLIQRADKEGADNAIVNARAIVAVRDSLRGSLVAISKQLNSEIDNLASELGGTRGPLAELGRSLERSDAPDPKRVYQTIQVLVRIWPSKSEQIEVEIRKLLAELGLEIHMAAATEASPPRAPAAAQ